MTAIFHSEHNLNMSSRQ